ncbi:tRNA adenosine(34) deaminase TadA [Candidatus Tachikawaea gelatinosa]|uniref:tRNA-specific adenosine deaminase n=1 Tax=Candidatus Tachikawaea gelatinosa TaxID=1410383 RepID=A0A090ARV1_9ENTR|nr:tRNA adenosine(34) deaminase TadA [Candidatus Tachikawaea gelatinosa]BAP58550.1 tRNA-specific adenosine-34 deaminase [Candidatus Tachikawaea gelatinosa]
MKDDEYWMRFAIFNAKKAHKKNEIPIGAILIKDNIIIGQGWNQTIKKNDPTAHAEILTLQKASKKLNNYRLLHTTLYVTLEPCIMCVGAILHSRISKLIYGAHNKQINATKILLYPKLNHHIKVFSGVLEKDCSDLLKNFFQDRRKK